MGINLSDESREVLKKQVALLSEHNESVCDAGAEVN